MHLTFDKYKKVQLQRHDRHKGDRMPAQPQSGCQSSHPLPLPWERTPLQVNRKHVWRACKLMFARHLKDQKILSWHNEEGLWKYSLERIWKACRLRTLHPIIPSEDIVIASQELIKIPQLRPIWNTGHPKPGACTSTATCCQNPRHTETRRLICPASSLLETHCRHEQPLSGSPKVSEAAVGNFRNCALRKGIASTYMIASLHIESMRRPMSANNARTVRQTIRPTCMIWDGLIQRPFI